MEKNTGPASIQIYRFRHIFTLAATSMFAAFLLFGAVLPLAEAVTGKASFTTLQDGTTNHDLPEEDNQVNTPFPRDAKAARLSHSYTEIQEAFRRQENTEEHTRACVGEMPSWFFANIITELSQSNTDHIPSRTANNLRHSRAPPASAR